MPSLCDSCIRAFLGTIGSRPIRVSGVVVVGVARRIDIPCIVGVAAIGRPQTDVDRS